ncbi:MAG: type II toxin-antitoxin system HicA family toxin [Tabrizicola sp.]|nr:type II toxin-antitoxin system HicA family toxin [Tabrizicola sp.]
MRRLKSHFFKAEWKFECAGSCERRLDIKQFSPFIYTKSGGDVILTNGRDIVRRLQAEGWILVSSKGSHHKFRKDSQSLIVPHPKKDLPLDTARSIARVAGWLKDTT